MSDEPTDPITPLIELASQMHEFYMAYIQAGFTEAQAMQLMCAYLQALVPGGAS